MERLRKFLEGILPIPQRKEKGTLFSDRIFGPAVAAALRPQFGYRWYPKGDYPYPTRPNWIFGGREEGPSNFTGQLLDASRAAAEKKPSLFFLVGRDIKDGTPVWGDLEEVISFLVTGVRGSGKTNALHVVLLSLMWATHPSMLRIHIFDLKRDFYRYNQLAKVHTKMESFVESAKDLREEMFARIKILSKAGFPKIGEYNQYFNVLGKPLMPYHLILIDEFAEINDHFPEFGRAMDSLAAMGRSAGMLLVFSTQRADSEKFPPSIKSNMTDRLSFAQADEVNERISGVEGGAGIRQAGHGVIRLGIQKHFIASPFVSTPMLRYALEGLKKRGKIFREPKEKPAPTN